MWYSKIYIAFLLTSIISFIISIFTEGKTSYNSLISGYSSLIIGLMMILTIVITKIMEFNIGITTTQLLMKIVMSLGPFLLLLSIVGFILYLIIVYKDPIVENHVSNSYHKFSNMTISLIIIQIAIFYYIISSTKEFKENGKISVISSSLLYLCNVISLYSTMIMYIILKYYRTDGFQGLQG